MVNVPTVFSSVYRVVDGSIAAAVGFLSGTSCTHHHAAAGFALLKLGTSDSSSAGVRAHNKHHVSADLFSFHDSSETRSWMLAIPFSLFCLPSRASIKSLQKHMLPQNKLVRPKKNLINEIQFDVDSSYTRIVLHGKDRLTPISHAVLSGYYIKSGALHC
jgi:hypothetical protein